jgi:hypothetical protein
LSTKEVILEALLGLGVHGVIEVGGDELDELLTRQMGCHHTSSSSLPSPR